MQKHITITMAAAAAALILFAAGCSSDDKPDCPVCPPAGSGQTEDTSAVVMDPALILLSGEAWVDTFSVGLRDGFIFSANGDGRFTSIYDTGSVTSAWFVNVQGRISADTASAVRTMTVRSGWLYHALHGGASAAYTLSATKDTLTLTLVGKVSDKFVFVKAAVGVPAADPAASKRRASAARRAQYLE